MSEPIAGIIPFVTRKQGLFKYDNFNVIVTPKRMIFAIMTGQMMAQDSKERYKEGFLTGIIGGFTAYADYYKRYEDMSPEAALKENPQNFFIDLSGIRRVRVREGSPIGEPRGLATKYTDSFLEIDTVGEKYRFVLQHTFISTARDVAHRVGLL